MNKLFQICLFDDNEGIRLMPYQLTRPAYTMPIGMFSLVEKLATYVKNIPISLTCSKHHDVFLRKRFPQLTINQLNRSLPTLFINGRINLTQDQFKAMINGINFDKNYLFIKEKAVLALFCQDDLMDSTFKLVSNQPSFDEIVQHNRSNSIVEERQHVIVNKNWWDYLNHFDKFIASDFQTFSKRSLVEADISSFSCLVNDQNMYIDTTTKVKEYVSLDATNGPIIILDNVTIQPFTRIVGPCFIGSNSTINSHTEIKSSYIGHHCKVGGELNNTIFQSYSNKAHYGYIGDSIIGEWVNLGAGTTTSNLKITYGDIQSKDGQYNELINTKRQFLGTVIGDYTRTSIQTGLDCGSVIGSGCTLLGRRIHEKFIPPFTWGKKDSYAHQDVAAFLTAINRMMARRNQALSDEESLRLKALYDACRQSTPSTLVSN